MPSLNETLSSLKCVQITGGSKSLFCGTLKPVLLLVIESYVLGAYIIALCCVVICNELSVAFSASIKS
jgi:hypothetical protein